MYAPRGRSSPTVADVRAATLAHPFPAAGRPASSRSAGCPSSRLTLGAPATYS